MLVDVVLRALCGRWPDVVPKEEAARCLMAREVRFRWDPVVVELSSPHLPGGPDGGLGNGPDGGHGLGSQEIMEEEEEKWES